MICLFLGNLKLVFPRQKEKGQISCLFSHHVHIHFVVVCIVVILPSEAIWDFQ